MANHNIPKCPTCGRFTVLKNRAETDKRFGKEYIEGTEYHYYCDNLKCGNNKIIIVIDKD